MGYSNYSKKKNYILNLLFIIYCDCSDWSHDDGVVIADDDIVEIFCPKNRQVLKDVLYCSTSLAKICIASSYSLSFAPIIVDIGNLTAAHPFVMSSTAYFNIKIL